MKSGLLALAVAAGTAMGGFMTTSSQGSVHNQTISAFQHTGTLASAYDYDNAQFGGNGNGILSQATLEVDSVNVFLVNSTVDGLGIFVVFGNGVDNAGVSQTKRADGTLSFAPGSGNQTLLVEDDAGDQLLEEGVSTDPYSFDFRWVRGYTDGMVSTFGDGDLSATLDLTSFANVTGFTIHGANGTKITGSFGDVGGLDSASLSDYITITAIPLPQTGALACVGLLGIGVRRRR